MSDAKWTPDDSFLSKQGREGINRINGALAEFGFSTRRDQILTSRDPKMNLVIKKLTRTGLPPGWRGYQIPVFLLKNPPTFFFYQRAKPGSVLPLHSHAVDQIRIVIAGSLTFNRRKLKAGDWMFIPANLKYSLRAQNSPDLEICYMYG